LANSFFIIDKLISHTFLSSSLVKMSLYSEFVEEIVLFFIELVPKIQTFLPFMISFKFSLEFLTPSKLALLSTPSNLNFFNLLILPR